jgi:hypothetical protein
VCSTWQDGRQVRLLLLLLLLLSDGCSRALYTAGSLPQLQLGKRLRTLHLTTGVMPSLYRLRVLLKFMMLISTWLPAQLLLALKQNQRLCLWEALERGAAWAVAQVLLAS